VETFDPSAAAFQGFNCCWQLPVLVGWALIVTARVIGHWNACY